MFEAYEQLIKERLEPHRFQHSINVAEKSRELARRFGADENKAYLAGLLHDICKNDSNEKMLQIFDAFGIILDNVQKRQQKLWHAVAGAAVIEHDLQIKDRELIEAVRYHTTARANMTLLDKILYLADFVSADRDFEGVQALRDSVNAGLDEGLRACLKFSVLDLCNRDKQIHPDTIDAYNQMV